MNSATRTTSINPGMRGQRGVALVIALILLVVITLLGLAAMRATTVQNRMTANFYDREVAFQAAEAALRAGAATIGTSALVIARDCGPNGVACQSDPFTDPNLDTSKIQTVANGSGSGQFTTGSNAASQPQYVIELMGAFANPQSSNGFIQTANAAQYGAQGVSGVTSIYYRITARSGDPSKVGDRAVVTLQAMYRQ